MTSPMLLAVDVGNTNIVFALADGEAIVHRWRIATDARRTADEYVVWLNQLLTLERVDRERVTSAIIASVVPAAMFELSLLCRAFFHVEPQIVGAPGLDLGLRIDLPNPAEVGADRLVNAVAAHAIAAGDLIVVDFGTATTFDVVGADGSYRGGVIAPGIALSMEALFNAAARLPRIAVEPPGADEGVIGRSTVHAMRSGVFFGYIGLIEGLTRRITSQLGTEVTVIGTGGLAALFERHTSAIQRVEPDLTIRGLIRIHQLNLDTE